MNIIQADEGPNNERARLYYNRELRHIEESKIRKLSAIIDSSKDYDRLLERLTRPELRQPSLDSKPAADCQLYLSMDSINLIKDQIHCGKSPTMALLNHWAITGRRRPTVKTLLHYLQLCDMKRAENYARQEILGLKSEPITPAMTEKNEDESLPIKHLLPEYHRLSTIEEIYKFDDLNDLAEKLSSQCSRTKSGAKIGEGSFSSVYRASTKLLISDREKESEQQIVAAKLLKSECNKAYLVNEINLIGRVDHENVLKFLGVALGESLDEQRLAYICLIYPYMENGSLQDCLSKGLPARDFTFLNWPERVILSTKVARGISYLHNFKEGPVIHRDIKTANILLDVNLEPKLGDFTTVRQIDNTSMTQYTQTNIGTQVYMSPEANRGDISIKLDSFSFGVVLLELLTGMRPKEEQEEDILTRIRDGLSDLEDYSSYSVLDLAESWIGVWETNFEQEKADFLSKILDKKAGKVDRPAECGIILGLAIRATEDRKNYRASIDEILPHLEQLTSQQDSTR